MPQPQPQPQVGIATDGQPPPPQLQPQPQQEGGTAAPFVVARTYSDAAELFWAAPPEPGWCVRARRADGELVPLAAGEGQSGGEGGGVSGCWLPGPAEDAAAAAMSRMTKCVVGGLSAGEAYAFSLHDGCDEPAALFVSEPALVGPAGAQCASLSDQAALFTEGYMDVVNECGHSCWGKAACSKKCLRDKRKLTDGCASCWGDVVGCGAWNCW